MNLSEGKNQTLAELGYDCARFDDESSRTIENVNFWVEGVIQTSLAVPGLVGEKESHRCTVDNGCNDGVVTVNYDGSDHCIHG